MKVLQINATYGYGSTGLIMKDIGDMLTGAGHDAHYAYQSCVDVSSLLALLETRPEKIAAKALQKARVAYDKNKCYKKYLKVYESLLK